MINCTLFKANVKINIKTLVEITDLWNSFRNLILYHSEVKILENICSICIIQQFDFGHLCQDPVLKF